MPKEVVEVTSVPVAAVEPDPAPVVQTPVRSSGVLVEAELLVEDVSIDGMCGVY